MVIGTVKGDIHDIGKNLVSMMMEGAGFEVVDIGIDNPVENYLAAIEEHEPDILGMSALLTTTMPYMKVVIETLKETGHPRRLYRPCRRCAAERGIRPGGGRRRLLLRCRGCGGNRQGLHEAQAQPAWRHDDQLTHGGCAGASPDRTNCQERPAPRHSGSALLPPRRRPPGALDVPPDGAPVPRRAPQSRHQWSSPAARSRGKSCISAT